MNVKNKAICILLLILSAALITNTYSQRLEHFSIHYSVNDISYYRNIFSSNKVKTVTISSNEDKKIYRFDKEGKITGIDNQNIPVKYIYDSNNNLTTVAWPMGDDIYQYDAMGNVIKEIGDEIIYNIKYDSDNNLTAIDASESMIEAIGTKSIQYKDNILFEISYECMGEGNYNQYTKEVYSYSENKLTNIKILSVDCKTNNVKDTQNYDYEYNEKGLPIKELYSGSDNNAISDFTYEFYE